MPFFNNDKSTEVSVASLNMHSRQRTDKMALLGKEEITFVEYKGSRKNPIYG